MPDQDVGLRQLQDAIEAAYGDRDRDRGVMASFAWLVEEVGELSRALRRDDRENLEVELSDVVAWTATVANLAGVDLAAAMDRYVAGCPKCDASPCTCPVR